MKSPFPGMDPYLERHWGDVHADIITLTRTALNRSLPDDLVARMEERVVIDVDFVRRKAIYPDVRVYEDPTLIATGSTSSGVAVAEPIVLSFEAESRTESYITILDADGGELVTVIECVSPSNKLLGPDCDQYRRKRDQLLAARVNLVEIDLLRQGSRREFLQPVVVPARVTSEYSTIIWLGHAPGTVELYPMSLRARLPAVPIPLRPSDARVAIDLQSIIDQTYENGRYDHTDYSRRCEPPLADDDSAWANERIAASGK